MSPLLRQLAPLAFIGQALAWAPPDYSSNGMTLLWVDEFDGAANTLPDQTKWNIINADLGVNEELETYTNNIDNVQLSGSATVQLIPEYNDNGIEWTSGRIESSYTFTPAAGVVTWAESCFRLGSNAQANKQGVWPAFWLLGDLCRQPGGPGWPECGEIDIMEEVDGDYSGVGTIHWQENGNNDFKQGWTDMDYNWHYWRLAFDRTSNDWTQESIIWYYDSQAFFTIHASDLDYDEDAWEKLCHSPLYFILNVAIGGGTGDNPWPGFPNSNTWLGAGSMLEAAYVGVWQS